ncbi:tape measure protein [Lachnospiraceae bacterium ZAX-1]
MATSIGSAYIEIFPDMKAFGKQIKSAITGEKFNSSSSAAGKSIGGGILGGMKSVLGGAAVFKLVESGINMIKNSVGDAVKRFDTIQNFPNVMKNFGVSAEDASKAMKRISDGLQGLPTTLDQGASAVQRFTSKTGDVNKATDYFLALNNAVIAGGAPMDLQTAATEQLAQAYAKGKPDMTEWRSMVSAMPAQLSQVAKAMGMTTEELGVGLREGNISMDDFMDKIVELNTTGVDGFDSFAVQARNAVGGIGTSIGLVKTAVVRGVADMISAMQEWLKDSGFGSFGDIFQEIREGVDDAFKSVADALPKIASFFLDIWNRLEPTREAFSGLFSYISDNAPSTSDMISTIKKAVEGFADVANRVFPPVVDFLIEIWEKTSPIRKAFTDLFSDITKSSPDVSSAIGFIADAIRGIADIANVVLPALIGFIQSLGKHMDIVIPLIAAFVGGFIAYKAIIAATTIAAKIYTIAQAAMNLAMSANPIAVVVIAIAALVAAVIVLWNTNEDFRNSIIQVFKKIKEAFNAVVKVFKEGVNNIADFFTVTIPNALNIVKNFFINIWNNITTSFSSLKNSIGNIVKNIAEFFTVTIPNAVKKAIDFFKELPGKVLGFLNDLPYKIGYLVGEITVFFIQLPGKIWNALKEAAAKMASWVLDMTTKAIEVGTNVLNSIVKFFTELPGKIANTLKTAWNNFVSWGTEMISKSIETGTNVLNSIVKFFTELPGKIVLTLQTAWNNFVSWGADMISKASETGANAINSIVSFFQELPGKVIAAVSSLGEMIKTWALGIPGKVNEGIAGIKDIGKNLVEGFWNGITGAATWLMDKVKGFATGILDGMKNALKEKSPSKATEEMGVNLDKGLGGGIVKGSKAVAKQAKDFAKSVTSAMSDAIMGDTAKLKDSIAKINEKLVDKSAVEKLKKSNAAIAKDYKDTGDKLAKAKKQLATDLAKKTVDQAAVKKDKQAIADLEKEYKKLGTSANKSATELALAKKQLAITTEINRLESALTVAATKMDDFNDKLEDAKDKLKDAQKAMSDYAGSVKEAFKSYGSVSKVFGDVFSKHDDDVASAAEKLADAREGLAKSTKNLISAQEEYSAIEDKTTREALNQLDVIAKLAKENDELTKSVKEQQGAYDEISKPVTIKSYTDTLKTMLKKSQEYAKDIQALRDLGLGEGAINDILAQGVESGSELAKQLVAGADKQTISELNKVMEDIANVGGKLGDSLSKDFYQNGVDVAQGLVDGINSKMNDLKKTMADLGDAIAEQLRKSLEIHSPSKVMKKLGRFIPMGLADGIEGGAGYVERAVLDVAEITLGMPPELNAPYISGMNAEPELAQQGFGAMVDRLYTALQGMRVEIDRRELGRIVGIPL